MPSRALAFLLLAVSWVLTFSSHGLAETVWLDELDLTVTTCGWNTSQANLSVEKNPLRAGGKVYARGVGTHTPGHIAIDLHGEATRLTTLVAIDDEVGSRGHAEFLIVADGKIVWRSGFLTGADEPKAADIPLHGVKQLVLVVDAGPEGYAHDHTDWLDAKIEYSGRRPTTFAAYKTGDTTFVRQPSIADRMDEVTARFVSLQQQIAEPMPGFVNEQAYRPEATILNTDRDPVDVILRRTRALMNHLRSMEGGPSLLSEGEKLDQLERQATATPPSDVEARRGMFAELIALRRQIAFQNPLLDFDQLLFIKRHFNPEPEQQGNHMCDQFFGFHGRPGGGLFVLDDAFSGEPKVRDLLKDATVEGGRHAGRRLDASWAFLSPELSFDATKIYFAATDATQPRHTYTWTEDNCYHIFEVNIDGTDLRQLTDGPFNDFDPCLLPSGRIAFISERRGGYGRCHGRPVPSYTLHSMNADGSDIVMLSPHETNEWQPSVDHNGMIIYTRWDYVDRGFNQAHHPWITTPDGRDARIIHGNYGVRESARPHFEADVRAIPGSHKLVATASCHHGQSYGSLVVVDPKVPDDNAMAPVRRLTPDQRFPEAEIAAHRDPANYATAWPLSEDFHLCVYDAFSRSDAGPKNNYGIYLIDSFGNRDLIYRDPNISCLSPIPLKSRPTPPVVPHRTLVGIPLEPGEEFFPPDPADIPTTARVAVMNVYDSIFPMPQGTHIAELRIVQLLPKTTPYAHNPAIGYGDQKGARAVLGTVPVEADGSANFELPVNIPVYFQVLDENGLAVQSMRSATYVHPGEDLICQGCHERRSSTPLNLGRMPMAMRRLPSVIKPEVEGSMPFSYPRLVQPVLDKHCVQCHAEEPKAIDLARGPARKHFHTSYENLRPFAFYYNDAAWTEPNTYPGRFGAKASKLHALLAAGHHDVQLSAEEMRRITLWLDSNSDFYGSYENCAEQAAGQIVYPTMH